jgi:lipopolysaccharide transport system ATP-binding protein
MISIKHASVVFRGNLNKSFLKGGFLQKNTYDQYALSDINIELHEGDRVGVIGRNGAGKTTFLRMLAGIHTPISGKISSKGSISCLTQLGLYSDGEMTGRDVINLEAIGRGLTGKDLKKVVDKSIEWTKLEGAIDRPIKTYSSGMHLRISIVSSTIIPTDILLMDEWLSVGDIDFQQKTELRLQKLLKSSSIFVIATHSMEVVRKLCNKVIILDKGVVKFYGPIEDGIKVYTNGVEL